MKHKFAAAALAVIIMLFFTTKISPSKQVDVKLVKINSIEKALAVEPVIETPSSLKVNETETAPAQEPGTYSYVPETFGYLDPLNNIFGQEILGGYYLRYTHNAHVALTVLNNYTLAPGQIFSFNSAVGERTPGKGYVNGISIRGDKYVTEFAGGICKASTAIYNAALRSGMDIIERYPHTLPVGYASRGLDSAVYYRKLDLKFKNNRENPVEIKYMVNNGIIFVALIEEKTPIIPIPEVIQSEHVSTEETNKPATESEAPDEVSASLENAVQ